MNNTHKFNPREEKYEARVARTHARMRTIKSIYVCVRVFVKEINGGSKWTYQREDWPWEGNLKGLNDDITLLNRIKFLRCYFSCLHQALIPTLAVPQSCM
jgi:hypothetical protein